MERPTESIRQEHAVLARMIEEFEALVDRLRRPRNNVQNHELQSAHHWLETTLLPHAKVEETHLYPLVDEVMGGIGQSTATMGMDHEAIRSKIRALGGMLATLVATESWYESENIRSQICVILAQLLAMVRLHFEKEELIFLNLLDEHLTRDRIEGALSDAHHHEPSQENQLAMPDLNL